VATFCGHCRCCQERARPRAGISEKLPVISGALAAKKFLPALHARRPTRGHDGTPRDDDGAASKKCHDFQTKTFRPPRLDGTTAGRRTVNLVNHFFSDDETDPAFSGHFAEGLDGDSSSVLHDVDAAGTGPAAAPTDTYWSLSRTPLTSLVFSLPLVLAYEGGVLLLGRSTPRNGADVWLRQFLDMLGFGSYFLLPVLTVLGLLAWHHVEHDRWRFRPVVLLGMAAESLLWALLLVSLAGLQERLWPLAVDAVEDHAFGGLLARFVGFCGAGLYEEVLFRLLLLPAVVWILEKAGLSTLAAAGWGVMLTSLAFSAAHYVGPLGDTFSLYSFLFRALAGVFFSLVFLLRGFGVVAGTHAAYDLLVGLM